MNTRQNVKKGLVTPADALKQISPDCATAKWLARRIARGTVVTNDKVTEATPKNKKYRHKPHK